MSAATYTACSNSAPARPKARGRARTRAAAAKAKVTPLKARAATLNRQHASLAPRPARLPRSSPPRWGTRPSACATTRAHAPTPTASTRTPAASSCPTARRAARSTQPTRMSTKRPRQRRLPPETVPHGPWSPCTCWTAPLPGLLPGLQNNRSCLQRRQLPRLTLRPLSPARTLTATTSPLQRRCRLPSRGRQHRPRQQSQHPLSPQSQPRPQTLP